MYKIGFGSYSTVWLAKDSHTSRYVALKIILSDFSANGSETQIIRLLMDGQLDNPAKSYVGSITDEFFLDGPNGRHLCLVSEPAKCNVAAVATEESTVSLAAARVIAAQAVLGLKYIHSLGVVHGGK